jgi:hypothetical protein
MMRPVKAWACMGTLFKVMAFMHRALPAPPGFEH